MKHCKKLLISIVAVSLASCASTTLNPQASKVQVAKDEPSSSCKYIKDITASQGGIFSGLFTSNITQQQGAYNALRNKALADGGNYVYITHQGGVETSTGNYQPGQVQKVQTSYDITAKVYNC